MLQSSISFRMYHVKYMKGFHKGEKYFPQFQSITEAVLEKSSRCLNSVRELDVRKNLFEKATRTFYKGSKLI